MRVTLKSYLVSTMLILLFMAELTNGNFQVNRPYILTKQKVFEKVMTTSGVFDVNVGGDMPPSMQSIEIECLEGTANDSWVLNDDTIDTFSVKRIIDSLITPEMDDFEKMETLLKYVAGDRFIHPAYVPVDYDTLRLLNIHGIGFCAAHSTILYHLGSRAGIPMLLYRMWRADGHTVNLGYVGGAWRVYDSDVTHIMYGSDCLPLKLEDISVNPDLVWYGADEYLMAKSGRCTYRTVSMLMQSPRELTDLGFLSSEPPGVTFPRLPVVGRQWKEYLETGQLPMPLDLPEEYEKRCHLMNYKLHAGEKLIRGWKQNTLNFKQEVLQRNGLPCPRLGKGNLLYQPSAEELIEMLGTTRLKHLADNISNLEILNGAKGKAIGLQDISRSGFFVLSVETNYLFCSSKVSWKQAGDGSVSCSWSTDDGHTWQTKLAQYDPQGDNYSLSIHDCDGLGQYYLRIELTQTGDKPLKITEFKVDSDLQVFQGSLPALHIGKNRVSFRMDSTSGAKVKIKYHWIERQRNPSQSYNATDWGWSQPEDLENFIGRFPSIAKDDKGGLHLVWQEESGPRSRVAYSYLEQDAWEQVRYIADSPTRDTGYPDIAIGPNGTIHVVYQQGSLTGNCDIFYREITDKYITPPRQVNVTDPYHLSQFPSIAVNSQGQVFLVWRGPDIKGIPKNLPPECTYYAIVDESSHIKPKTVAHRGTSFASVGPDDAFYFHTYKVKQAANSQVWSLGRGTCSFAARAFIDGSNTLYGVFDAYTSGSSNEIYLNIQSVHCSRNTLLLVSEDDGFRSTYSDVAVDEQGNIYIVWMDRSTSAICGKVLNGKRWSPDLRLSTSTQACKFPRIIVDGLGRPNVFWYRTDGTSSHLQWCKR